MTKEQEIWKDVKDYEGSYQISNFGRVKSIYLNRKNEIVEKYLAVENRGSLTVVFVKDLKKKTFQVKKLVAEYFIPNPENKKNIIFIDNVTKSLHFSNLKWVDQKTIRSNVVSESFKYKVVEAYSQNRGTIKDFAKQFPEFSYITIGKILREKNSLLLHNEEKVEWKTLPELTFEDKVYEVSNTGFVRKQWNGQILKPHFNGRKYITVLTVHKKTFYFQTHLLVAKAFLTEYDKSIHDIIHLDEDISNNNKENLGLKPKSFRGTYSSKKQTLKQKQIYDN